MCKIKQLGQRAFIQKKKIKAEVVSCLPSVARLLPTWAKRSKLWRPSFLYPQRASQRKQRWWEFCSLGDFKRIKKKHFLHSVGNAMFMKTKRTRWVFHLFERNRIVLWSCPLFYSNCIPVFCGAHLYLQRQKNTGVFSWDFRRKSNFLHSVLGMWRLWVMTVKRTWWAFFIYGKVFWRHLVSLERKKWMLWKLKASNVINFKF